MEKTLTHKTKSEKKKRKSEGEKKDRKKGKLTPQFHFFVLFITEVESKLE